MKIRPNTHVTRGVTQSTLEGPNQVQRVHLSTQPAIDPSGLLTEYPNLAFFGAGRLAKALITGLLASGYPPANIGVSSATGTSAKVLAQAHGLIFFKNNAALGAFGEYWIPACKPAQFQALAQELHAGCSGKWFISILSTLSLSQLRMHLPGCAGVVRLMPTVASQAGEGITPYCFEKPWPLRSVSWLRTLLNAWGTSMMVEESQMNAVTAICGCGPAYVWEFAQGLLDAAAQAGLDPEFASLLIQLTLISSAKSWQKTKLPPTTLRDQVASAGGATEAALVYLAKHNWTYHLTAAAMAAHQKLSS